MSNPKKTGKSTSNTVNMHPKHPARHETGCKKSERAVAVAVLTDVVERGAYANIALREALADAEDMLARGRAFVTELVNETLRNLLLIDHAIDHFSKTPTQKMKPFIRNLLRVSVCQLRHMDKIPDRAAVNEAVVLARAFGFNALSGFVNGVLRNISRNANEPALPPETSHDVDAIALRYSYPKWMVEDLVRWLGSADNAAEFCRNSHLPPGVTVFENSHLSEGKNLAEVLQAEGVEAEPVEQASQFLALRHTGDLSKLDSFRDGLFFVMDPGGMAAVEALDPRAGQTIIDLCAAPGGKAFAAACLMQNTGRILAFDIHAHRVRLIEQNRARLGLSIVETCVQDALIYNPELHATADAVLLDAPCSGLGTLRKHPEIKYTRTRADIGTLAQKQLQMMEVAAKYVKPGGVLVYCTCTIAPEENMYVIRDFLDSHENFTLDHSQQTLPTTNSDGFFTARMTCILDENS